MKTDKLRRLTAASLVLAFTLPQAAQAAAPTATPAMKGTATFAGVGTSRGRTRTVDVNVRVGQPSRCAISRRARSGLTA